MNMKKFLVLALLVIALPAQAALIDLTLPGDSVQGFNADGFGAHWPSGESPPKAIDDSAGTKYLNFGTTGGGGGSGTGGPTGLVVHPRAGLGVVTGMSFTTANDNPPRDPLDYVLEGSADGGASWSPIASGLTGLPTARFATTTVSFPNAAVYGAYRLAFPTLRDPGSANSMQVAEIELLIDDASLLADVTQPLDPVVGFNADGPGADWPEGEEPLKAIDDDPLTKYLNFGTTGSGGGSGTGGPTGLVVSPALGQVLVSGLGVRSGNDSPPRDPAIVELLGSNDGVSFDLIERLAVPTFPDRRFLLNFAFENTTPYFHYRVSIPEVANPGSANSMQLSEVQLYGRVAPEPATLGLLGLGALALARRRRGR
ncbi:MAG: PEP-CTERM sorting domain-containing protein [Candidatus Brocadiia bacterium]